MMRETIRAALDADETFAGLMSGGVYAGVTISRSRTPGAYDANGELLPCALVRIEADTQHGPYTGADTTSTRLFVVLYCYQRSGYDAIDPALDRAKAILHRSQLGTGTWDVSWASDSSDLSDEALGDMRYSRYVITRKR